MSTWQVIHGDCLEVLRTLPAGSVDAVVTDPPYGINTKSDGSGKLSPWGDLVNSAFWYAEWFRLCRRVLKSSGCMWSFLNWRSLVTFQKAACDVGWPIESLLVWDKQWIGPGGTVGLRPSYELVALWGKEEFAIADRGLPDVRACKWSSQKPTGHPAEKPVDLVRWLLDVSCAAGGVVADPFCGSGTTGVAAVMSDRAFIGIEQDEHWAESARRRISEAANHLYAEASS